MSEQQQNKPTVIRFGKFKWVVAAFIFGLIAGMCLIAPMGSQGLFESNFIAQEEDVSQAIDMGLSTRGSNTPKEVAEALRRVRAGFDHYDKKEYPQAIAIFEEHLQKSPEAYDPKSIKFYLGVSYLAMDDITKAKTYFEELVALDKFSRKEDTQWYLALTYIKDKNAAAAKPLLSSLSQNGKYKEKAENLLKNADNPEGPKKERPVVFR